MNVATESPSNQKIKKQPAVREPMSLEEVRRILAERREAGRKSRGHVRPWKQVNGIGPVAELRDALMLTQEGMGMLLGISDVMVKKHETYGTFPTGETEQGKKSAAAFQKAWIAMRMGPLPEPKPYGERQKRPS